MIIQPIVGAIIRPIVAAAATIGLTSSPIITPSNSELIIQPNLYTSPAVASFVAGNFSGFVYGFAYEVGEIALPDIGSIVGTSLINSKYFFVTTAIQEGNPLIEVLCSIYVDKNGGPLNYNGGTLEIYNQSSELLFNINLIQNNFSTDDNFWEIHIPSTHILTEYAFIEGNTYFAKIISPPIPLSVELDVTGFPTDAVINQALDIFIPITGGNGDYELSIWLNTLPPGLELVYEFGQWWARGIVTQLGTYEFGIQADSFGLSDQEIVILNVITE